MRNFVQNCEAKIVRMGLNIVGGVDNNVTMDSSQTFKSYFGKIYSVQLTVPTMAVYGSACCMVCALYRSPTIVACDAK